MQNIIKTVDSLFDACPKSFSKMILFCTVTRIALIAAVVLSNICLPDHEASGVYTFDFEGTDEVSNVWTTFIKWDAAYFLRIARHGYEIESNFAFFPLYPMLIRVLGQGVALPTGLSDDISAILAGVLISNCCFVASVAVLWCLLKELHVSERVSSLSLILFCFNPANVFFVSVYSESFYSCMAFAAILSWEKRRYPTAVLLFILASGTRSNGLFNSVFIVSHVFIEQLGCAMNTFQHPETPSDAEAVSNKTIYMVCFGKGVLTGVCCCVCCIPFVMYSAFVHSRLCPGNFLVFPYSTKNSVLSRLLLYFTTILHQYGITAEGTCGDDTVKFCCNGQCFLEVYGSIQFNHWNVGFMRYYVWKQLPNFMLAFPVLMICLWILRHHYDSFIACLEKCTHTPSVRYRSQAQVYFTACRIYLTSHGRKIPYLLHMMVVVLVALIYSHVQISTRLLFSSCPLICFHICDILETEKALVGHVDDGKQEGMSSPPAVEREADISPRNLHSFYSNRRALIACYFIVFNICGVLMHPNFLPWT
eukprot:CAMPEP_0114437064 /NCGR_PEP_ID=MMETSP0103-20121206/13803_1 /TAXON_ID=37642 ORGANISM="Paraphysomonas imperforata, Strain PA2" /NCGR_SAMPLE_ID=MMETSP0103 /ASSEMBLY_ACC=CAM_ASM_000201 /LENGTH=533 /DNA_ID=CAMNT_0001607409 /DNA_START=131 /DNA_END=1732 /DNA_ORIENTATION=-